MRVTTGGTMNGTIQRHNERLAAVWSAGGRDYDEISRGIADSIEHCVLRLSPQPRERILDVSTGTGWTSRVVARLGATVVGTDFAGELLDVARERSEAEGLSIEYRLGDAESLPFATGEFDAVVSTFGIMFASDPEAAAGELARVCRKGGRVALTTWSPDGNVFRMFQVMKRYMPPPALPASPSPFEWGRIGRIRELLGCEFQLGFEEGVSYYRELSGETAWDTFSKGYGPIRSLARSLEPAQRESLYRDFTAFHDGFPTELGICVPRDYVVAVGVRF
jgi:SAM-dependent methyltransferase